jgi:ATP-dependent RNA circularization protein (DNA/RNA ligase family)
VMKKLYKYPRTFHLPWSEGVTSDDKILHDLSLFENKEIVILEKMDGENTTMMKTKFYVRSLDSKHHYTQNHVKGIWGNINYLIPDNWRICGENLYAKHSIGYNNLSSYFMVFNIWNDNNMCLSFDETIEMCKMLNLTHVPIIYKGIFDIDYIKKIKLDYSKQEGYVIRLAESFNYDNFKNSVVKFVRKNHVTSNQHWLYSKIEINKLL